MTHCDKPSERDVDAARLPLGDRVGSVEPRAHAAWRTWLAALAEDPDAVAAAVLTYESLSAEGREAWLEALEQDAPTVGVPPVALYAPLLGVEEDERRRERIIRNVVGAATVRTPPTALVGGRGDDRLCLIVTPLYLDFVELLFCRYDPAIGIREAWHERLARARDVGERAKRLGAHWRQGVLANVVEELAHAVVADRRHGRSAPPSLLRYIDLFAPTVVPAVDNGGDT